MLKHRETLARARSRASAPGQTLLRTGGMSLVGALLGYFESAGTISPGFWPNDKGEPMIPTKVAIAVGSHLVAAFTSGTVAKVAGLVGDTAAANYGYAAGLAHSVVAG